VVGVAITTAGADAVTMAMSWRGRGDGAHRVLGEGACSGARRAASVALSTACRLDEVSSMTARGLAVDTVVDAEGRRG
jgi:hypothetical protein